MKGELKNSQLKCRWCNKFLSRNETHPYCENILNVPTLESKRYEFLKPNK